MNNFGSTKREYFYIASGELNKMYVLRYFCHEEWFAYDNSGENQTDHHVRNLSIDWKKAVAKANEYVKRANANRAKKIRLLGEPVVLDKIVRRDKEVIAAEKEVERLAQEERANNIRLQNEYWDAIRAERNNNFIMTCWANHMARECKRFDALQTEPLDTENRITMKGTVKAIKQYPDNYSYYNDYIYKAIIELDGGQTVFGSVPSYEVTKSYDYDGEQITKKWKQGVDIGDNVMFDAKLEKPDNFDGTFYYYKRPTKVKLLNQVKECA